MIPRKPIGILSMFHPANIFRKAKKTIARGSTTLVATLLSLPGPVFGAINALEVGQPLPRATLLTPGVRRYARYLILGDSRTFIDLWTRTMSFEDNGGSHQLHIHQRWDAADKSYVAIFDQLFEAKTLRPLSQTKSVTRNGVTKTLAIAFNGSRVDSTSDDAADAVKPLHENFDIAFYNFHTDIELLQTLPLKTGYVVSIPFYDVGLEPPMRYVYSVTGEETIAAADGTPIKCWVLVFQPDPKNPPIHFWFAQRNQALVREEASAPGQGTLVKTLLSSEASDSAR